MGASKFFVDFVKAFDTVPQMSFKALARLGLTPKIVNLVRLFDENVTLEVDLDDDAHDYHQVQRRGQAR